MKIIDSWSILRFQANILWNSWYYDSYIEINKHNKSINDYCTCPAYGDYSRCKHIWALARSIDDEYDITDDINIDLDNEIINPLFNPNIEKPGWLISDYHSNPYKNNNKSQSLSILNKISEKYNKKDEENLYKIKLNFIHFEYDKNEISLRLYKSKIQKNWKMSAGKMIYLNDSYSIPQKYKKLVPFLEEKSNYRSYSRESLTFSKAPELFMSIIFWETELYDTDNNLLIINKTIFDLKIKLEKNKEWKYKIILLLVSESDIIKFNWYNIYGSDDSDYLACLTSDKFLFFFKTSLSIDFIQDLSSGDVILTKDELEDFKKSKKFSLLIENAYDIDDIWVDTILWTPKEKFIISMGNSYELVKLDFSIDYDGYQLTPETQDKHYLINEIGIIKRNFKEEENLFERISPIINMLDNVWSLWWIKYVDDKIDDFFDELENLIKWWAIVEYNQTVKRISNKEISMKLDIKSQEDWFDADLEIKIDDQTIEDASKLLKSIKKSNGTIILDDGTLLKVKDKLKTWVKELEELWIDEKKDLKNIKISKHNIWLLKDKTSKKDSLIFWLDREIIKLKKSLSSFKWIKKEKLSENINATLRDYQKEGYNWINFLQKYNFSGILADDMGLGKTLQTLAILQKEYDKKSLKTPSLIVCPTSLVLNWIDEIKKFTPKLKAEYISNSKDWFKNISKDTQVIVVSYGIIANMVWEDWLDKIFYYLVLDEAQNIKNPSASRSKSIKKINSKYRLALSGTPIENNLIELWSAFDFLMPGFLSNLNNFKEKYISNIEDLEILSRKVRPFILRRTKEEVLKDLPPKVEEIIHLEMWDRQKKFYNKLKEAYKMQINNELKEKWLNKSRFAVLDALLKLRQACLSPELVKNGEGKVNDSIKLEYIEENIEDMLVRWHNMLIFSQFTGFLSYVKKIFDKKWIKYNYLDWSTKPADRKTLVDSFNASDVQVFIISLKAWGTWLNLTNADYVIHLDPWWNPAVENQATDRAHRMGQKKTVFVQKLIVKDSIEEKILKLQEKKKKMIDDVFSGDFTGSLTEADIWYIFE